MKVHQSIFGCEGLKLVGGSAEVISSFGLEVVSNLLGKAVVRVQTSADRSASLSNLVDILKALSDTPLAVSQLVHVARELLAEGERSGILGVSATDLHDVVELSTLGVESICEGSQLGEQALIDLENGCDVHDRWESVIAGLRAVHMVVRVHHLGAKLATQNLDCAIRDNFVAVHVGLSAGAGLPNHEGEVVVELAGNHLVGGLNDCIGDALLKAKVQVGLCCTLFEETKSSNNGKGHALALATNLEVLERALCLSAPITVSRDLKWSESVRLLSELL